MSLIDVCVCGSTGPFERYVAQAGVECDRCECGVAHQVAEVTREDYEQQYRGAYHAAVDRHPGCVPYRQRYEHDYAVARIRFERYLTVLELGEVRIRTALDVGCAAGAFVDYLRARGIRAFGTDPDPAMAREEVFTGSIDDVRFEQGFDLITIHDVLEHLVDPVAAVRAAADRLAPGGALVVDVPDVSTPAGHHHYKVEHLWYFTAESLLQLADEAGLVHLILDQPIPGKLVIGARRPLGARTLRAAA